MGASALTFSDYSFLLSPDQPPMQTPVAVALLISLVAGLSTALGGLVAILVRRPGPHFNGLTLGFAAGVMILLSFQELLSEGIDALGMMAAMVAFFVGMGSMFVLDFAIPHDYIEHHDHPDGLHDEDVEDRNKGRLSRTALLLAIGIAIHNFPEGMATFVAAMHDLRLGLAIGLAVAIHNVPEGIAVAAPVYAATGSRVKAFLWALYSGLAEPLGAVVAAVILFPFLGEALLGWLMAGVAGCMVAIALDEAMPAAKLHGSPHTPMVGAMLGMAVAAGSVLLLR